MFADAFNPVSFRRDGRDVDSSLQRCYVEWMRIFSKELANELYATSLRLEQSAKKIVTGCHCRLRQLITEQLPGYSPPEAVFETWPTPKVSEKLSLPNVTLRWIRGYYRNNKSFFEGNGRNEFRQALEMQTMQAVKVVTEAHRERFIDHLSTHYKHVVHRLHKELSDELERYREQRWNALNEHVNEGLLRSVMLEGGLDV